MASVNAAKSSRKTQKRGRKRRRNVMMRITGLIISVVVIVWFAFSYTNLESRKIEKAEELSKLEEQLQEKKKELNKKNMEVNYYQSDENIEKIARDELGLVMPQEIVFIQSN